MNVTRVILKALAEAGAIFVASIVRQTVESLKAVQATGPNGVSDSAGRIDPQTGQSSQPSRPDLTTGPGRGDRQPAATAPVSTPEYRRPEK